MTFAQLGVGVTTNAETAAVELDGLSASALRAENAVDHLNNSAAKLPAATKQMSLNSANIAAQFQDIAVTAQMGMSPLQIALQQGTQLSAALGDRGLKGTVQALGTAFMSIISPVSIITIALIGLGTWGAQALGNILTSSEEATDALEEHAKWLDTILNGYESAADAAEMAAKRAEKLPQGVGGGVMSRRAIGERGGTRRRACGVGHCFRMGREIDARAPRLGRPGGGTCQQP